MWTNPIQERLEPNYYQLYDMKNQQNNQRREGGTWTNPIQERLEPNERLSSFLWSLATSLRQENEDEEEAEEADLTNKKITKRNKMTSKKKK